MARRRFSVDQIIHILRRIQKGDSDRSIAKCGFGGRNKIRDIREKAEEKGWLGKGEFIPPEDELAQVFILPEVMAPEHTSKVEPYRDTVAEWVKQGIRATTIFDALKRQEPLFEGSYGSVLRFVQNIRAVTKEAYIVIEFEPGECAQVDFGSGPILYNPVTGKEQKTYFFVMTLCCSRHMYVEFVWDQKIKTWLRCHKNAFAWFKKVPKRIILDNLKSAILKACRYDPVVQRSYEEFAREYGFIISPCKPRMPRHKGRVESGVKYIKKTFLPLRDFRNSMAQANQQVREWIMEVGNRIHGTTKQMPLKVFVELEQPALLPLPENPADMAVWAKVKLHPDCHVTYEKAYYSAPYKLVGLELWLKATDKLAELFLEKGGKDEQVALHLLAERPGQRRTNPDHLPPEKLAFFLESPQWCIREAEKVGAHCREFILTLLNKGPVDYLRAAQGVIRLRKKYGGARLEAACYRALLYDNITYRAVNRILKKGLDLEVNDENVYHTEPFLQKSRFGRDISELLYPEKQKERSIA
jgi:transposase